MTFAPLQPVVKMWLPAIYVLFFCLTSTTSATTLCARRSAQLAAATHHVRAAKHGAPATKTFLETLRVLAHERETIPEVPAMPERDGTHYDAIFPTDTLVIFNENKQYIWEALTDGRFTDGYEVYAKVDITQKPKNIWKSQDTTVWRVQLSGKDYILRTIPTKRPKQGYGSVRKTYAASKLNQLLSLTTVPRSHFANLGDGLALLCEFAKGESREFTEHEVDHISLADVRAFEFLVGNTDLQSHNIMIDAQSKLHVFDHDLAFMPGLQTYDPMTKAGTKLPDRYTKHFLSALQGLSEKVIRLELGSFLTEREISWLLIRREMILRDAATRGDSAILVE